MIDLKRVIENVDSIKRNLSKLKLYNEKKSKNNYFKKSYYKWSLNIKLNTDYFLNLNEHEINLFFK